MVFTDDTGLSEESRSREGLTGTCQCKQFWSGQGGNSVIRMFVGTEHVEDVPNQDLLSPEL